MRCLPQVRHGGNPYSHLGRSVQFIAYASRLRKKKDELDVDEMRRCLVHTTLRIVMLHDLFPFTHDDFVKDHVIGRLAQSARASATCVSAIA